MSCGAGNSACEEIRGKIKPDISELKLVVLELAKQAGLAKPKDDFDSLIDRLRAAEK